MRFIKQEYNGQVYYRFWCPGCQLSHSIVTQGNSPIWDFNEDINNPTVSPSIRVTGYDGRICHSFIKNGCIEFLTDCTHILAGKTIELPEIKLVNGIVVPCQ